MRPFPVILGTGYGKCIAWTTALVGVLLLSTHAHATDGLFVWGGAIGGPSPDEIRAVETDAEGNVFMTGIFRNTADFDPGPGNALLTAAGGPDVFVAKLNRDGEFVWARALSGNDFESVQDIALGPDGSVYTIGQFTGTVDFDPGPDEFNITSAGESDIFVSKLDGDGNFVWAHTFGAADSDQGEGIAVDFIGNVYITGTFLDTVDFDPGPDEFSLTAVGESDIFVTKLNSAGNLLWAKAFGGESFDQVQAIAVDGFGNATTTGILLETMDFDPGPETSELTARGIFDVFVSQLNSQGEFVWARGFGGVGTTLSTDIAVDALGSVYTTGRFSVLSDFDPGPDTFELLASGDDDIFVSKLSADGQFDWAFVAGGLQSDGGQGIALDDTGNVFIAGYFTGAVDFDPGAVDSVVTASESDAFVTKLDPDGNFVWVRAIGGDNADRGTAITVDGEGELIVAGTFEGAADLDPGPDAFLVSSLGVQGAFVVKLGDEQVPLCMLGDVNCDDFVNAVDVQVVINAALGIDIGPEFRADINESGSVNAVDVQLVINAALGIDISDQV